MKSKGLRNCIILVGIVTFVLLINSNLVLGKGFPRKPILIVNSWGPGGTSDLTMRGLASVAYDHFGQTAMVICKPGGTGIVAGDFMLKQKPDGHTVVTLVPSAVVPEVYTYFRKATYTSKDLKPVCATTLWPFGLHVKGDSQFQTLEDLINYARQNPGKLSYAHCGRGHSYFLLVELIKDRNNLEIKDVPFKSGMETAMAVMGGHLDFGISASGGTVDTLIKAGKLRLLGVQHHERLPAFPDVPTFEERGYKMRPHYSAFFVHPDTPDDVVIKLQEGFKGCLEDKSFKSMRKRLNFLTNYGGPEVVREYIESENKTIKPLLEKLGFTK